MMNYNPYYSPYQNQMNAYQQYQPQYQQIAQKQEPSISGRIVSRIEDIQVAEIPMDGTMSYFPNGNMTEIYGKRWNADGTVSTIVYKAVEKCEEKKDSKDIDFEPVLTRLDNIEEQISKLFPKRKKESDAE